MDNTRIMCLSCGRFVTLEKRKVDGKTVCPFCRDMYFCDNIDYNQPPYIEDIKVVGPCGHMIITDFPGDIKWCPDCSIAYTVEGPKMKNYQMKMIEALL
jgi:hypothetical protein